MTAAAIHVASAIITISICLYFSAITYLCVAPLVDGLVSGCLPRRLWVSALCENVGIACCILGLTFRMHDVNVVGAMAVVVSLLISPGPDRPLHPAVETSLVVFGILSLGTLAVVYGVV
jgi:hypothetical protein